jgi:hypothetical protein
MNPPEPIRVRPVRLRDLGNITHSVLDYWTAAGGPRRDSCGDPAGPVFWALYKGDIIEDFDEDNLLSVAEFREHNPKAFPGELDESAPACWKNKRDAIRAAARANTNPQPTTQP